MSAADEARKEYYERLKKDFGAFMNAFEGNFDWENFNNKDRYWWNNPPDGKATYKRADFGKGDSQTVWMLNSQQIILLEDYIRTEFPYKHEITEVYVERSGLITIRWNLWLRNVEVAKLQKLCIAKLGDVKSYIVCDVKYVTGNIVMSFKIDHGLFAILAAGIDGMFTRKHVGGNFGEDLI